MIYSLLEAAKRQAPTIIGVGVRKAANSGIKPEKVGLPKALLKIGFRFFYWRDEKPQRRMKIMHISKILTVGLAIVFLSGQAVYAWDKPSGFKRIDSFMRDGLSKTKDAMKKAAPYLVQPGVGIGVKIANPEFRQRFKEGVRKIGPHSAAKVKKGSHLFPVSMGIAGITAFRSIKTLREANKTTVGGNNTASKPGLLRDNWKPDLLRGNWKIR